MKKKLLTKSLFLAGYQCPKLLWIKVHEKERIPKTDETRQARFDTGYEVEALAKRLFLDGKDAQSREFVESLNKTKKLINGRETVFEPSFVAGRLYSRADVLKPNNDGTWNIYEIKSATRVKEVHIVDLSFQKAVYESAGLKIKSCNLILINNEYILEGDIDIGKLFKITDVTDEVRSNSKGIDKRIEFFLEIIDSKKEPCQEIGMHCDSPYDCPLKYDCWKNIKENSIFDLYNINQKSFELYSNGICMIRDIPKDYPLTQKQLIQKVCIIENKEHINRDAIKRFLGSLEYPIHYLDFETINPAIPKYQGMRPFQRIPFQFSLHIQEEESSNPKHISFLHKKNSNPREDFIAKLKESIRSKGSIIVYNKSFEQTVINEAVKGNEKLEKWFESLKPRFMDLLEPFRKFDYYNHNQGGSTSIKTILPNLSNLDYSSLEIAKGDVANTMYEKALKSSTTKEEKEKIFENLSEYCKLDTLAEYEIVKGLKKKITTD